jgi:hypothetical protein
VNIDRAATFRVDLHFDDGEWPCARQEVIGFYKTADDAKAAAIAALEEHPDENPGWWSAIVEHGRWVNDPIDDEEYGLVPDWDWEYEADHTAYYVRDDQDEIVCNEAIAGPLS